MIGKIKNKKNKGITLIALVITIIVLLILAGVSIATLTGENGILTQASTAKEKNSIGEEKEQIKLAYNGAKIVNKGGAVTAENLNTEFTKNKVNATATDEGANIKVVFNDTNRTYTINSDGTVAVVEPPKPTGKVDGSWDEAKGVNTPVLKDGMELLKYDEATKDWVVDSTNTNYNYVAGTGTEDNNSSQWANARLNGNYYVWIPRYAYKIDNSVTYTSQLGTSNKIDVKFIETSVTSSNITDNYIVHPAFTFGTTELPGIWVGKYETTGDTTTPTILPNQTSLKNANVSTMFNAIQEKLSTTNYDAHMMKNIEWGAVAYLAQSPYGRNGTEISVNQCGSYYTGEGKGTGANKIYELGIYAWDNITEEQKWNGEIGVLSSTTGNVYGVYDMSGGASEYVMGVYGTEGNPTVASSGFTAETFPERKYYDLYTTTSADSTNIGDALYETSGWNRDSAGFILSYFPFFRRGGSNGDADYAGTFNFNIDNGKASNYYGCRVSLTVK